MPVEVWIGLAALVILLVTIRMQQQRTRDIRSGKSRARGLYGGPGEYAIPNDSDSGGGDGGGGDSD
jgi:hypothetical protein